MRTTFKPLLRHLRHLRQHATTTFPNPLNLQNPSLFTPTSIIANHHLPPTKNTFPTINPHTTNPIYHLTNTTSSQIHHAITTSHQAYQTFHKTNNNHRGDLLRRWAQLMRENKQDIARMITLETGKGIMESRWEVEYAAGYADWYGGEAERLGDGGRVVEDVGGGNVGVVSKRGIGVVGVWSTWNLPVALLVRKIAGGLAAGCGVVGRVGVGGGSGLVVGGLLRECGLMEGVVSLVVVKEGEVFGEAVFGRRQVRGVSFTGGVRGGKEVYKGCVEGVKRVCLELGGLAGAVVMDDVDVGSVVEEIVGNKFRMSGQTCVCVNNVFVQKSVVERFVGVLERRMGKVLKIGDPFDEKTTLGPLISQGAVDKVDGMVKDAVSKGAKVVMGGYPIDSLEGFYYAPTILTNVSDECQVANTEIFGPVVPITSFETEEEVIEKINKKDYGLASYVFTRDLGRAMRLSRELESGMVGVNTGAISDPAMPFGGVKHSGIGREGGSEGIEEFLDTKYTLINYGTR